MPSYMAGGTLVVAEAILRRWTTSPGQLIDDGDYGYSLVDLISQDLSPSDIAYAQTQAGVEAEKDERVLGAVVQLDFSVQGVVSVSAIITTANGPFSLTASVSAIGVSNLLVSP
jgi:hypothetical protein